MIQADWSRKRTLLCSIQAPDKSKPNASQTGLHNCYDKELYSLSPCNWCTHAQEGREGTGFGWISSSVLSAYLERPEATAQGGPALPTCQGFCPGHGWGGAHPVALTSWAQSFWQPHHQRSGKEISTGGRFWNRRCYFLELRVHQLIQFSRARGRKGSAFPISLGIPSPKHPLREAKICPRLPL